MTIFITSFEKVVYWYYGKFSSLFDYWRRLLKIINPLLKANLYFHFSSSPTFVRRCKKKTIGWLIFNTFLLLFKQKIKFYLPFYYQYIMYLCGAKRVICTFYSNEPYKHHIKSIACIFVNLVMIFICCIKLCFKFS